ncbi:MAG: TrmH family RNA methyltransferase, partial [Pseudomonadota bacterium]
SGTDHSQLADWSPNGPIAVLVAPQLGENIGAAARGLWNFGLRRMRLVNPRDGWPNPAATAMASGAGGLLDEARVFEDTAAAVADCQMVYATTARPREMTKRVLTPEEAMGEAAGLIARDGKVAVLFGPERAGLDNSDVGLASAIITVPVNPAFASINLAQSVLLMAYEWRRAAFEPAAHEAEPLATSGEVGRMVGHLVSELDHAGFFYPEGKRPSMIASLENLFRRAPLTEADLRTLWGVIRALAEGPKRGGARAPAPADLPDMAALRQAIDAHDQGLLAQLARRRDLILRAAEIKQGVGLPARIDSRVEEVVSRVRAGAERHGLDAALMEQIWRALIEAAIALEETRLR